MAGTSSTTLDVTTRDPSGSRNARRLRKEGRVPAVIYGGDGEPLHIEVDARTLRNTLAHGGAVLELGLEGKTQNVLVKQVQRHPVRGEIMHADFLRVDMKVAIQAPVTIELVGGDESPGVSEGGVLSQETREVTVEALPGDLPEVIEHDVSGLEMNATLTLADITAPSGVTFVDDPETTIASITPPTAEPTEEEIETETAVVGEDGEAEAAQAEGATGDEAEASAGGDDAGSSDE
jgi:large subunit ribosomal protein L25